jgi:anti-sigma B factor antagonist
MTAEDYLLRRAGSHAILTMPAEIDLTNADQVRQALFGALGHDPVLIVDMTGTTFCDSAGVQAVIAACRVAGATGTEFRLVATAVLRIFTVVGADQLISVYPTLEDALADLPS